MQSVRSISLHRAWKLTPNFLRVLNYESSHITRTYVSRSAVFLKDDGNNKNNNNDKITKQNELIRILNQTKKEKSNFATITGADKGSDGDNNVTGGGSGSDKPPKNKDEATSGGSGNGSGKRTFHCTKCGALCTHVDSLVSLSR